MKKKKNNQVFGIRKNESITRKKHIWSPLKKVNKPKLTTAHLDSFEQYLFLTPQQDLYHNLNHQILVLRFPTNNKNSYLLT